MEQKKKEKDVLIVRDEHTGEIGVVAGLNADGSPKQVPAKATNQKDFLQFDRHGDIIDNFFKNFFAQCKEPNRFGFYRIAADQVDSLLGVMRDLLQHPYQNKHILAPHKVDTFSYMKQAQEQQNQNSKTQIQETMEQKQENVQNAQEESPKQGRRGYQPIDESKINWQELEEKWGVKYDDLKQSGDLAKMLNYGKSDLIKVTPNFGGEQFELEARLSFRQNEDGSVGLVPHFIRKEQKLDEYKGHKFSAEEKQNLRETGNLGRIVDLVDKETGEITPSYISIDRKTNEIVDVPASKIRIPDRIGKTEITPQEKDMLRAGLPVRDKLMTRNNGNQFVITLQVSADQKGIEFVPGTSKSPRTAQKQENGQQQGEKQGEQQENGKQRRNSWMNEDGSIKPIGKWKGVQFTEEQKAAYTAGNTVKLENVPDDKGNPATIYVKFNREKGRPETHSNNPDTAQKVAPSNESRTQVAVNNDGKTNEATKNVKESLQQGQNNPKNDEQKQQQEKTQKKGKGMKV